MHTRWLLATSITALSLASAAVTAGAIRTAPSASTGGPRGEARLLVSGLGDASGSAVGPDGALYVTHGATGRISRIDPLTGRTKTFASGLPPAIVGLGGVMDVAFLGRTAYALVTLVGSDVGGTHVVGLYRIDGPETSTVIADIGQFAIANPPRTPFDVPSGLQFALETYRGGFLVSDGHHNRVLRVTLDGTVTELMGFDNIVPTGLAATGDWIYMAQAGPVPHLPEDGRVVRLEPARSAVTDVASGAPLLVDVELNRAHSLYALSQGEFPPDGAPAAPALPDTGALLRVNWDGTLTALITGLDRPTSLEFIRGVAYVVTLTGEVWRIDLQP
jgi:hypothetical protein